MKTAFLLIFIFLIISCSDKPKQSFDSDEFPIELVKKKSMKRRLVYKLNDFYFSKLQPIDSLFFRKWFNNKALSNVTEQKIQFDQYTRYYYFDYKDFDKMFLFSIVQNDEVGFSNLYHFTYDKVRKDFSQIDFLSSSGGDGGDQTTDILYYNKEGNIARLSSVSTSTEDDFDNFYTQNYDSSNYKIEFKQRETLITRLDSLIRLDTIRTEE